MNAARHLLLLAAPLLLAAGLVAGCADASDELLITPKAAISTLAQNRYLGSTTCNTCHKAIYESWEKSNHTKKIKPAEAKYFYNDSDGDGTDDFQEAGAAGFQLGTAAETQASAWASYATNAPILLYEDGAYKMQLGQGGTKYTIDYVMGASGKWKSRYMTRVLTDGRETIYTLPIQYDIKVNSYSVYNANHWYNTTDKTPLGTYPPVNKSWEANCLTCHATGATAAAESTKTGSDGRTGHVIADYTEKNIGCEACHGMGAEHVSLGGGIGTINNPKNMGRRRAFEDCQQCHDRGEALYTATSGTTTWKPEYPRAADGRFYRPGDEFDEFYEEKAGLWADVHTRSKSHHQQATDFKRDTHYEHGVQCFDCHDPHGSEQGASLKREANALCLGCHEGTYDITRANLSLHTRHPITATTPNRCIDCHAPYMAKSSISYDIRTHNFKIVYPIESDAANGGVSGMPNSCQSSSCHADDTIAELNGKALTMWGKFAPIAVIGIKDLSGATDDGVSDDSRNAYQLDASRSIANAYHEDGSLKASDLTYEWRIIQGPGMDTGTAGTLVGAHSATPYFLPKKPGTYVFELIVTDAGGAGRSDRSTYTLVVPDAFVDPTVASNALSVEAGTALTNQGWGTAITAITAVPTNAVGTVGYLWEPNLNSGLNATFTGGSETTATPAFTTPTPLAMVETANDGTEYRADHWRVLGFSPLERKVVLTVYATDDNTVSYSAGGETVWYNRASDSVTVYMEGDTSVSRTRRHTGLSTVGVNELTYFMGAYETTTGTKLLAWQYTFTTVPGGSVTTLPAGTDNVASTTRWTFFTPDTAGEYVITYTGYSDAAATTQATTGTATIVAANFVGAGRQAFTLSASNTLTAGAVTADNTQQCATAGCHTAKVSDWKGTNHAEALAKGLTGLKGASFSANCIDCHSTGYDTYASNNGFDDVATAEGWTLPTIPATPAIDNWTTFHDTVANAGTAARGNIQCERCHGPGSQHTAAGAVATTNTKFGTDVLYDDDQCQVCHDSPTHHIRPIQLRNSVHKKGRGADEEPDGSSITYAGARDGCAKCHSSEGFVWVNAGSGGDDLSDILSYAVSGASGVLSSTSFEFHQSTIPTTLYLRAVEDGAGNVTIDAYTSTANRAAGASVQATSTGANAAGALTLLKSGSPYLTLTLAAGFTPSAATDFKLTITKGVLLLRESNDGSNQLSSWTFNEVNLANTYAGSGFLWARVRQATTNVTVDLASDETFATIVATGTVTYTAATASAGTTVTLTESGGSGFKNGTVALKYSADDTDVRLKFRRHTDATEIGCVTCHDPHVKGGDEGHNVRVQTPLTLQDGTLTIDAGKGAVCIGCHQARRTWNSATTATTATSSHWGPHYGVQSDTLYGANGYLHFSHLLQDPSNPNSQSMKQWDRANPHTTVEDTCAGCHMGATPSTAAKGLNKVGEHTFRLTVTEGGVTWSNHENTCQKCHVNVTELDRHSKADYDGDGHVEGYRHEVEGLMEKLGLALREAGYLDDTNHPVAGILVDADLDGFNDKIGALWNFLVVEDDKSQGIHNPGFVIQLLQESYRAVTGGYPKGAAIR